jgi:hypothetical protein
VFKLLRIQLLQFMCWSFQDNWCFMCSSSEGSNCCFICSSSQEFHWCCMYSSSEDSRMQIWCMFGQ